MVSQNPQSTTFEPFVLQTDKSDYRTTDLLQISGQVIPEINQATQEQNTLPQIIVYTSTGQEVYRTFVNINAGGQFLTSVNLHPGIFKTDQYKVYGQYLNMNAQTNFHVTDRFNTTSNNLSLFITTDTDKYLPGQTVLITGRTGYIISIDFVKLTISKSSDWAISEGQIVSPQGNVLPKVYVPFDQTSSFNYDYKIPVTATIGNYSVIAQVPFGVYNTTFQIANQLPQQNVTSPVQQNVTQGNQQANVTQTPTPSILPNTVGPTEKRIISKNILVDKVNRITDSIIPITFKQKVNGNNTVYPRILEGLLLKNPGDETGLNIKLTLQNGTCLIGQDSDCKIIKSTIASGALYQIINVGNENYLVGYTGTGERLEKFTILPANANAVIPDGQWNVEIIKSDGQYSRFYYQITYASVGQ